MKLIMAVFLGLVWPASFVAMNSGNYNERVVAKQAFQEFMYIEHECDSADVSSEPEFNKSFLSALRADFDYVEVRKGQSQEGGSYQLVTLPKIKALLADRDKQLLTQLSELQRRLKNLAQAPTPDAAPTNHFYERPPFYFSAGVLLTAFAWFYSR